MLRVRNLCGHEVRVERLTLEYTVKPLGYDRRETSGHLRKVYEEIVVEVELLPNAELRLRLRDVESIEKVCARGARLDVCYQATELGEHID